MSFFYAQVTCSTQKLLNRSEKQENLYTTAPVQLYGEGGFTLMLLLDSYNAFHFELPCHEGNLKA